MIKKLPWKNIIIVFAAMLVVPVMAFAMTMSANPASGSNEENSNIKITSDENVPDAASAATSVLTSGALGYIDAASSATGLNQNNPAGGTDAISSATVNPGATGSGTDAVSSATVNPVATGSIGYDDDQYDDEQYESDDDEEEDDD